MNEKINGELKKFISEQIINLKASKENTFKVVATTEDVDRDGEIIKLEWWDFENYFKNPIILTNHEYLIENIAGKATKVYKEEDKVIVEGVFTDVTEAWQLAKKLYNSGFLKTVSVWFKVLRRNQDNYKIIEQAELYEISFVPVPANPNALSLETRSKAVKLWLIKEVEEENEENQEENTQEDIKAIKEELKEIKNLLIENQKFFDTLADSKAFIVNMEDDNSEKNQVKENYKNFLQNLNKNISNSLFELKQ